MSRGVDYLAVDVEHGDGQATTLGAAIKASSRSDLVMIGVMFLVYVVATVALASACPPLPLARS